MPINVVVAQAHQDRLQNDENRKEFENIRDAFFSTELEYKAGTINYVFLKGAYRDFEKKMSTVCVFVNKLAKPVKEIHGVIRLGFRFIKAEIARVTLNFDEGFIGQLRPDEGLLFNINIPVKGLSSDQEFFIQDIEGFFDEVRFTYSE